MKPTDFSQLIGNDAIKQYLQKMIDRKAIANSLLFSGPNGIGKSLFAQVLAAKLMSENDPQGIQKSKIESGNYPDIYHYRPEGKLGVHSMQSLRQFSEDVYLPPYESAWKIFIVHEAERMLSYSANALLKTFEEPPPYAIIILLSSSAESLLPTIVSRCRTVYFQAVSQLEIQEFLQGRYQLEEEKAKKLAILAQGSLSAAVHLAEKGHANRDMLFDILAKGNLKTYKSLTTVVGTLVEQIEASKKQIEQEAKEQLYKAPLENLSAHQQQLLEKELEGIVAIEQNQEAHILFNSILSWYRDLHLLLNGGDIQYLMNPDYVEQLEQALQRGYLIDIEHVQKVIEEARQALHRSMSLQVCLESLVLKLGL